MDTTLRILLVDDDATDRQRIRHYLQAASLNCAFVEAENGVEGLAALQEQPFDCLFVADNKPQMDGMAVLRAARGAGITTPIVILSEYHDESLAVAMIKAGATDYLLKQALTATKLAHSLLSAVHLQRVQQQATRAEMALRRYAAELEERNLELDEFASTVAHDLKNCFNPIIGMATLLREDYAQLLDEQGLFLLENIIKRAKKGFAVIEALLRLSSLRYQEPTFDPLDMGQVVAEAMGQIAHLVEESQAEISLPASWPVARGYAPWVEEVWVNYLSNGLKYGGQPPRLELGAERQSGQAGPEPTTELIRFWVRDHGPGLRAAEQASLFTPFARSGQERGEGHGLGLSIVKRIVKRLGGDVGVESQPGQGSLFWFTLPAPSPAEPESAA